MFAGLNGLNEGGFVNGLLTRVSERFANISVLGDQDG